MGKLSKGDFHYWFPNLLFLDSPVIYSSPVNICGSGRNLERDLQWVVAKIIDKKPTLLADLTYNDLNWPSRGEWGVPGQYISETPMGPITLGMVCFFWANSGGTGPGSGIRSGTISQAGQHRGQLTISSPPALQPLKTGIGLNRYNGKDNS